VGWDLSQVAGVYPLELSKWNVDFAICSSSSFLSAGPDGYGIIFWNKKHHNLEGRQLCGWFGNLESTRFLMRPNFEAEGIDFFPF
jgi:kynureninase